MMSPFSDLTGQPRPLPSVCLTGMTLPDYVTCFMIMTHVSDLNAHLRGQLMPPVATVTGWGRVGPEEAAPMSRQLLVTQVPSLLTTHHVSRVMSRSLCSVLRSVRHSPAPVCLTVIRSVQSQVTCHDLSQSSDVRRPQSRGDHRLPRGQRRRSDGQVSQSNTY